MFTALKLDDTGDITLLTGQLQMVSGTEAIVQRCRIILGTHKGEWFLNPELGIDHSKFFGKHVSKEEMHDEIVSGLMQESHIQTVDSVDFVIDRVNRLVTVSFTATGIDGEAITAEGVGIGG
ncbi:phage baseplate assembly protein W [Paenibacillus sp. PastF-3]|uniref:DUF2634 domain-containing protein n=1 Tax=Paenibacillus sp. PastF-3 TaxID=2940626 RepID=UPI002473ED13|nr:DUF2634 domain-containing protein [Paenibacillus sp. PastF-3]MDH6370544.1 phage baseplate assembly protein W [Paenibacillus sp. PastF-3]